MLWSILQDGLLKGLGTVLILAAILIPMMIAFEYASHFHLIEKASRGFTWLTRILTLSPAAAFPVAVGLFFGILFGAAVLVEFSRQNLISRREMLLLGIFLSLNHSVIEDNLIFTAVGANFTVLFIVRFIFAIIATRVASAWMDVRNRSKIMEVSSPND